MQIKVDKPSNCIAVSNNGKFLAIGSLYGEIYIYNTKDFNDLDKKDEVA